MSHSITDSLKARDASASKNTYKDLWKLCKCVQKYKNLKPKNMIYAFKTDLQI